MIKIVVNGTDVDVEHSMSVAELLCTVDVPQNYLAVEINEDVIPKEDHDKIMVDEGDRIEVVTLVGGG